MATKPSKTKARKPTGKVRDLVTRKDPKAGAQKKELPNSTPDGVSQTSRKRILA